jgi:protein ImuB
MSTRVCVLRCPDWPLVAASLDNDTPEAVWGVPMMIIHAGRVTSCSPEAREQGVFIGQRLRDAHTSCPTISRVPWSPERDQRVFDGVMATLADVVPLAWVIEPGAVALGAAGIARYYGSEENSARVLAQTVVAHGVPHPVALGYADTLFAADLAAHSAVSQPTGVVCVPPGADREFLCDLPTSCLGDDEMAALCAQLGLHTLGQFAALDRDQVAERFGHRGTLLHQLASGEDPRHYAPTDIPPSTDVVWRSDEPCESGEQLAFHVSSSATRFIAQLLEQRCVVQSVDITLVDDRGEEHRTLWSHPRYFTAADLTHRVRWQAESLADHHGTSEYQRGIGEVRFVAKNPHSAVGQEESLWGRAHRDTALHHTVSSLQGKLGHQLVSRVITHPGHDITGRQQRIPWGDHQPPDDGDRVTHWAGQLPAPHPATVFSSPLPVDVVDATGEPVWTLPVGAGLTSSPHWLISRDSRRRITAWAGPWPVMEKWWESRQTRCVHRVQLLDEAGIGWLVKTRDGEAGWVVEARYD